jgi:ribonuclease HI
VCQSNAARYLGNPTSIAYLAADTMKATMNDAATIISTATGCTLAEAQNAVGELMARGWTPPDADNLFPGGIASSVPSAPLAGLLAVNTADVLVAHTDGACSGNPGPGGWSVVFSQNDKAVAEYSGYEANTKNNRMELTAVREAIRQAPRSVRLDIVTDSKNVIGWLSQGWKRNDPTIAALSREIDTLRDGRVSAVGDPDGGIRYSHVLGHQGDKFNERADYLATQAIKRVPKGGR